MRGDLLPDAVRLEESNGGHPVPDNPSTHGSPHGSWLTPTAAEAHTQDHSTQMYLQNQVGAVDKVWATPNARDHHGPPGSGCMERGGRRSSLPSQLNQWSTPRAGKVSGGDAEVWQRRKDAGDVSTPPLAMQFAWPTPKGSDPAHAGPNMRDSAGNPALPGAVRGKLNPRWVEVLMGLPVGWVMPSCTAPVPPGTPAGDLATASDNRHDELRLLGNGVVPATATVAFLTLLSRITR